MQYSNAELWNKTKHTNFGVSVSDPVVIQVEVEVDKEKLFDVRDRDDYEDLESLYNDYIDMLMKMGKKGSKELNIGVANCIFFNMIHSDLKYDVIIVGFQKRKKNFNFQFGSPSPNSKAVIPFIEYQMCVYDLSAIKIVGRIDE